MIDSRLIAKRKSAVFSSIFLNKLDSIKYKNDFYNFFFDVFRPLIGNDSFYRKRFIKTKGLCQIVNFIGSERFYVLEAYRGASKTDVALGKAMFNGVINKKSTLVIVENAEASKERIQRLEKFVKSSSYFNKFLPENYSAVTWNANTLTFVDNNNPITEEVLNDKNELVTIYKPRPLFTVTCLGYQSGFRGARAQEIILEDLNVESTVGTLEKTEKTMKIIIEKIIPLANEAGWGLGIIGTPQHHRDILARYKSRDLFKTLKVPVRDSKGVLNCLPLPGEVEKALKYTNKPFVQDEDWLKEKVQTMSDTGTERDPSIRKEYFCEIVDRSSSIFSDPIVNSAKKDNLVYGYYPKRDHCVRIMGIDPNGSFNVDASKKLKKDYAAIVIADYNMVTNEIFLVETGRTHDIKKWESMIFSMFFKLNCDHIAYEGFGFSNVMQDKILKSYGNYNDVSGDRVLIDAKASGSKEDALLDIISYFTEGKIYIPYGDEESKNKTEVIIEEFQNIGKSRSIHDDVIDCIARIKIAAIKIKDYENKNSFDVSPEALKLLSNEKESPNLGLSNVKSIRL